MNRGTRLAAHRAPGQNLATVRDNQRAKRELTPTAGADSIARQHAISVSPALGSDHRRALGGGGLTPRSTASGLLGIESVFAFFALMLPWRYGSVPLVHD